MSNFKDEYLGLLRRQIDEEINFLVRYNHDTDHIPEPCTFCEELHGGKYFCERLRDLRRFLANIMIEINSSKSSVNAI
jgi:hypothetical protein